MIPRRLGVPWLLLCFGLGVVAGHGATPARERRLVAPDGSLEARVERVPHAASGQGPSPDVAPGQDARVVLMDTGSHRARTVLTSRWGGRRPEDRYQDVELVAWSADSRWLLGVRVSGEPCTDTLWRDVVMISRAGELDLVSESRLAILCRARGLTLANGETWELNVSGLTTGGHVVVDFERTEEGGSHLPAPAGAA